MILRVRQIIKINNMTACYNGKGDDGEGGFVHYFTSMVPGKETTFTVPENSAPVLSPVIDKVIDCLHRIRQRGLETDGKSMV
jgi:hypothetical protein